MGMLFMVRCVAFGCDVCIMGSISREERMILQVRHGYWLMRRIYVFVYGWSCSRCRGYDMVCEVELCIVGRVLGGLLSIKLCGLIMVVLIV